MEKNSPFRRSSYLTSVIVNESDITLLNRMSIVYCIDFAFQILLVSCRIVSKIIY